MASFSENLTSLRKSRSITQRKAAGDLQVSQALLSHYEKGAREPGLAFVRRACDYYNVSADYLLGRTEDPLGGAFQARALLEQIRALTERAEAALLGEERQP